MRDPSEAQPDSAAGVATPIQWSVAAVEPRPNWRLAVRFADGTSGLVDLNKLLFGGNPGVFEVLRDVSAFAQVCIDHGAVSWPGGLDLAPDAMYEALRRFGVWEPE